MKNTQLDIGLLDAADVKITDLSKELLILRLSFGKLKATMLDAFSPLAAVLIPALNQGIRLATRLAQRFGQFLSGLLGIRAVTGTVTKNITRMGAALKRSLAGFDQLERLPGGSGGSYTTTETQPIFSGKISEDMQGLVDRIRTLLQPLLETDLLPLRWNLERLKESFIQLTETAGPLLEHFWLHCIVPLAQWTVEKLVPIILKAVATGLRTITTLLQDTGDGFAALMQACAPVAEFLGSVVLTVFDQLRRIFANTTASIKNGTLDLNGTLMTLADTVTVLWEQIEPALEIIHSYFAVTFEAIGKQVATTANYLMQILRGVLTFLSGVFTGQWEKCFAGIATVCNGKINFIVSLLNLLLTALTGALNGISRLLNSIRITVPDWVPSFGGKTFSLSLPAFKAPQIPYLAKGAVLPANQPFLAMVGDQKHGTNIEAPLSTIEAAVANTMEDFSAGNMAGHQATVAVLQEILEAVLGIHIGDSDIAAAAERYRSKMAVMQGIPI